MAFFRKKKNKITRKVLYEVSEQFMQDTSFFIRMGAELEFFCQSPLSLELKERILQECQENSVIDIEEEQGKHQYEVQLSPTYYPVKLADNIIAVKEKLQRLCEENNNNVTFDAKPYPDQAGSGLHIHISLHDQEGNNLFAKEEENQETELMDYTLHGLLELLPASMQFFAPKKEDYARYTGDKEMSNTISWGGNNRSVALRLPETTATPQARRVEHRIPCASADPYAVLYAIVKAVGFGLKEKTHTSLEKMHGDAFLEKYSLEKLPSSLKEAKKLKFDI